MKNTIHQRMVLFTGAVMTVSKDIFESFEGQHLRKQLIRSATSASLNYSEALGGESRKDFIHKVNLVIKELRETHTNLLILENASLLERNESLEKVLDECNQLISIFVSSVNTATRNEMRPKSERR